MIDYIIKSAICLTVLLIVYHLFLENQKMHRFNRFFLLLSIVSGLMIPMVTMEIDTAPVSVLSQLPVLPDSELIQSAPVINQVITPVITSNASGWNIQSLILLLYGSGILIFLLKFAWNLVVIRSYISKHPRRRLDNVSLVLLPEDILPFSFLNYIFINDKDHKNASGDQLFTHELAHVRQRHSLDILFVELLMIIFWFNPIFILYKKAIQLNHEFLADDAVIKSYDVSDYQYLLVEKSIYNYTFALTSGLNYSVTKKRLLMMVKRSSGWKIRLAQFAMIPVIALLLFFFSGRAISEIPDIAPRIFSKPIQEKPSEKDFYFREAVFWQKDADGKFFSKKYEDMTEQEKVELSIPASPDVMYKSPTAAMLEEWKNDPSVFRISLDRERTDNSKLGEFKPEDFGYYTAKVFKNERGELHGYVSLFTYALLKKDQLQAYNKSGKPFYVYQGKLLSPFTMKVSDFLKYLPKETLMANKEMTKSFGIIFFPPPVVVFPPPMEVRFPPPPPPVVVPAKTDSI